MTFSTRMTLALLLAAVGLAPVARAGDASDDEAFFEARVRPVLAERCWKCHGDAKQSNDLRLDSREAALEGGLEGPAVVPGKPEESLLLEAVRQTGHLKMPPKEKLDDPVVADLADWIRRGAPWPAGTGVVDSKAKATETHWAFQPVTTPIVPRVADPGQVATPVDAFILARLAETGLSPSPPADRRTLIRRVTFDLTGLPPTPEEVEAFLADESPDAYAQLVERLLASPAYGERWARHWLDVARYADTKGYVFQEERRYPFSYTYRDYVIAAFNDDKPYDRFLKEQIAADLLPDHDPEALAALGFLTVGRRFLNVREDIIDDRIDVTTRGLMGLTVSCARCHDHKYDPIPTEDYYSLYGVFNSCEEPEDLPIIGESTGPQAEDYAKKKAETRKVIDDFLAERRAFYEKEFRTKAEAYLVAAMELELNPRHPKLDERARADSLSPQALRWQMGRWAATLDPKRAASDPFLEVWNAYNAVPEAEFTAKAPEVAARLAPPAETHDTPAPALDAFLARHAPESLRDVARRIGAWLAKVTAPTPTLNRTLAAPPPETLREVARRYGALLAKAANPDAPAVPAVEAARRFLDEPNGPFVIPPDELRRVFNRADRDKHRGLERQLVAVDVTHPGAPPRAMVLNDRPQPIEPRVFLRGSIGNQGDQVPRQFLEVLEGPDRKPFTKGSGRLELAEAIASPDNPLTARVLVNRVWMHHFGEGLVGTPSDFGLRSEPPTHPELLDYLASRFVEGGWSVKDLHRLIVLSNAYRQQSAPRSECLAADPENRLLWRQNRRRLDFEAMRDALLAVSGRLDDQLGGRSVPIADDPNLTRRSIYAFIDRQNLDTLFRTFDLASPDSSNPARAETTVPQQGLFFFNSPFVAIQARQLAETVSQAEPPERVARMYRRLFTREPSPDEVATGLRFVESLAASHSEADKLDPWTAYAQVLLMTNEFLFID